MISGETLLMWPAGWKPQDRWVEYRLIIPHRTDG